MASDAVIAKAFGHLREIFDDFCANPPVNPLEFLILHWVFRRNAWIRKVQECQVNGSGVNFTETQENRRMGFAYSLDGDLIVLISNQFPKLCLVGMSAVVLVKRVAVGRLSTESFVGIANHNVVVVIERRIPYFLWRRGGRPFDGLPEDLFDSLAWNKREEFVSRQ